MDERDEFMRDRVRPGQPDSTGARPPAPHTREPQKTPPPAARPAPPGPVPPRPPASPQTPPPPPALQHTRVTPLPPRPPAPPPPPGHRPHRFRRRRLGPPATPGAGLAAARSPSPTCSPDPGSLGRTRCRATHSIGAVRRTWLAAPPAHRHLRPGQTGCSAAQREQAEYETHIRSVLRGTHKVGVLGKGGVGKTSVAASVGSIFAELRQQDRVVAIDADTAFGRLSSRIDPRATGSFWELTADKNLQSFTDVTARLGRNAAGLYVLGGEPASGPRRVLDPAIYREATLRLDRHFTISVIDCGSTMDASVTQEVLRDVDALIVVSSPWADGASAAAKTMEWLSDHRLTDLLQRSVVVLNDSDGQPTSAPARCWRSNSSSMGGRLSRCRSIRIYGPAA